MADSVCTTKEKCQCSCCKKRGNRSKNKRLWTVKDLNRVALYVNRDQKLKPHEIIAEVAYFFGYGTLFCKSANELEKLASFALAVKEVMLAIAGSKLASLLKDWLLGKVLKLGFTKWLIGFALVAITFAEKLIITIEAMLGNDTFTTVVETNKQMCGYIKKTYGDSSYQDENYDFDFDGILKDIVVNDLLDISIDDFFPALDDLFPTGDMKP